MSTIKINTQGFGIQLAPSGFSLEANKIFLTYQDALEFAGKPAAYIGSVITVVADYDNNGAYYITGIGANAAIRKIGMDEIEELRKSKQNKIEGGSEENRHVIWSSEKNDWVAGKIEMSDIVSTKDANNNDILMVKIDENGTKNVIWTSSSTITKENITYRGNVVGSKDTITTLDGNSTTVYSTGAVDSMLAWSNIG